MGCTEHGAQACSASSNQSMADADCDLTNIRLYVYLKNIVKVHPKVDEAFQYILQMDPQGILVILAWEDAYSPAITRTVTSRVRKSLGPARGRQFHLVRGTLEFEP